jgi:hypothetical protein
VSYAKSNIGQAQQQQWAATLAASPETQERILDVTIKTAQAQIESLCIIAERLEHMRQRIFGPEPLQGRSEQAAAPEPTGAAYVLADRFRVMDGVIQRIGGVTTDLERLG